MATWLQLGDAGSIGIQFRGSEAVGGKGREGPSGISLTHQHHRKYSLEVG